MSARSPCNPANSFKVCLIGNTEVGKSCIAARLVSNTFSAKRTSTIGSAYMMKELIVDGQTYYLNIWDTAGQEKYRSLAPLYYRDASAILLVYDITNEDSFASIRTTWVPAMRSCTRKDIVVALVGNKLDLQDNQRLIPSEEARGYADILGAIFSETSAKTGENVTDLFAEITRKVHVMKTKTSKAETPLSVIHLPGDGPRTQAEGPASPPNQTDSKHKSGCRCLAQ